MKLIGKIQQHFIVWLKSSTYQWYYMDFKELDSPEHWFNKLPETFQNTLIQEFLEEEFNVDIVLLIKKTISKLYKVKVYIEEKYFTAVFDGNTPKKRERALVEGIILAMEELNKKL